jgi:predicted alpha-1,2-mannosidase
MKKLTVLFLIVSCILTYAQEKQPVDYVNPYMGNISYLLVPTFPTVHLPNSMLRVYPERADFTADSLRGLPLVVTSHRGRSAFNLSTFQGDVGELKPVISYTFDREKIRPYFYEVDLDDAQVHVGFAPAHRSAVYQLDYTFAKKPVYLILNSRDGSIKTEGNTVSGFQNLENGTKVYIYLETEQKPLQSGILKGRSFLENENRAQGRNACAVMNFGDGVQKLNIRYGISFISEEQARRNLESEIKDFDVQGQAARGREIWNRSLGKIRVDGGSDADKAVFYTSLYRCFERPVCISEGGQYFSAFDHAVHSDNGTPFYTDDWIWDTYRAHHPLRVLIDRETENSVIRSFLLMAEQMGNDWMPTFPEITGDSRRMNSNHAVATVLDAYVKGLRDFDLEKAYTACKKGIEEKTLIPWSGAKAGWLDDFYKEHGYIPALYPDEEETVKDVNSFEKRQPVAVTLGTSYDQWCLSEIAGILGKTSEAEHYAKCALNYRNLYNPQTGFFHPKDKDGKFIEPFDYRFSGGKGARDYYDENNGWTYRWDVQHNIPDLISLMGGNGKFIENLERTFNEPLGKGKSEFYAQLPDQTGNVGQFSMANEPSLHIPYLYNYAGQPWKTQKRIHSLIRQWFRNDLFGVPGDEDGGGTSAFVVFSMTGFYPVTPGMPVYTLGSPFFENIKITLSNGKIFEIEAVNYSEENKYIQSAMLNGKTLDKAWFNHSDIENGGKLVLVMGNKANREWGIK